MDDDVVEDSAKECDETVCVENVDCSIIGDTSG